MGLACSQARLLTLTTRKSDCEYRIAIDSSRKMALTREMTQLSSEYYSKLQAKKLTYYANGKYNKINYGYLMGYGKNYGSVLYDTVPFKNNNSMVLTDYTGKVVLKGGYVDAIKSVFGADILDNKGNGGSFDRAYIPNILSELLGGMFSVDEIKNGVNSLSFEGEIVNTKSGNSTGTTTTVDATDAKQAQLDKLIKFYYPILLAAANNGWTTQYNDSIDQNESYISDAIITGALQLECVNEYGQYDENTSLTYFVTTGGLETRSDADSREEVTAWYNAEKDRISEEETYIDVHMENLSTELEAIKTEIQSVQTFIDDAIQSVFDWGSA